MKFLPIITNGVWGIGTYENESNQASLVLPIQTTKREPQTPKEIYGLAEMLAKEAICSSGMLSSYETYDEAIENFYGCRVKMLYEIDKSEDFDISYLLMQIYKDFADKDEDWDRMNRDYYNSVITF